MINQVNLAGFVISDIDKGDRHVSFIIGQKVGGKMPSKFTVWCTGRDPNDFIDIGLKKGSSVLVMNGILYQKDEEVRIKITDPHNVINMDMRKDTLDKGVLEITEPFA